MSYATAAPGQQAGSVGSAPPICQNCETSTTPLWRRDESGSVLCNACGLFLKLHGRPRPISLKTDIIKSRNRVKVSGPGGQKRPAVSAYPGQSLAAAHPDIAHGTASASTARRASNLADSLAQQSADPNASPRSGTPSQQHSNNQAHPSNIAPQHMFDGATLDSAASHGMQLTSPYLTHSPTLQQSGYTAATSQRRGSPSSLLNFASASAAGSAVSALQQLEGLSAMGGATQAYADLLAANTSLKTRVSELEVINGFFRERVAELEASEADARRQLEDALRRERERGGASAGDDGLSTAADGANGFQDGGEADEDAVADEDGDGDESRAKRMKMDDLLAVDAGEVATASKDASTASAGTTGRRSLRSGNTT